MSVKIGKFNFTLKGQTFLLLIPSLYGSSRFIYLFLFYFYFFSRFFLPVAMLGRTGKVILYIFLLLLRMCATRIELINVKCHVLLSHVFVF